ncbi:MAG: GerMN domain-containing protein [Spirochaetes bacterium]|nr:GerMN domain-containing protein [Spirochaetota bacterium]
MARNIKKAPQKKKATAKKKTKSSKTGAAAASKENGGRSRNAVYVLVIMGLITALALLSNRFISRHKMSPDVKTEKSIPFENISEKDEKPIPDREEKARKPEPGETAVSTEKPEKKSVKVYFVKLNEKTEKLYLSPVNRKVERNAMLENAIKELIRGPSSGEKRNGYLNAVPADLRINGIRLRNRTAEIDFNGAIERGATGSILLNRIDQIIYTATQFENVRSVVIKINGKTRQTLGSDGLSISGPLDRRR